MIIFRQIDKGKSWWKHLYGEMNKLLKRYITTPKDEQCYMSAKGISFLKLVQKYGDLKTIDEYLKTIPKHENFKIKFPLHYNIDNIDIKLNEYTSFTYWMYSRTPVIQSKLKSKLNITNKDSSRDFTSKNSKIFSVFKPIDLQEQRKYLHIAWMDAITWLDRGRYSVFQWKRLIQGIKPPEEEALEIDTSNIRSNATGQKDFIHNLRIMDAHTDAITGTTFLADFADDDYYGRKSLSTY